MSSSFQAFQPREAHWSDAVGGYENCPNCGTPLIADRHTYMLEAGTGDDAESFLVGSDSGYFCPRCPTIVLDREVFKAYLRAGLGREPTMPYDVQGIVDLSAIPESKAEVPIGDDDKPVPLVPFTNSLSKGSEVDPRTARNRRKRRKRKRH